MNFKSKPLYINLFYSSGTNKASNLRMKLRRYDKPRKKKEECAVSYYCFILVSFFNLHSSTNTKKEGKSHSYSMMRHVTIEWNRRTEIC